MTVMTTEPNKMGACDICRKNRSKYRCPRCETVTCSLMCCKAHKRLKGYCDGIRDKTKYVPMEKITSMEISSGRFWLWSLKILTWNCSFFRFVHFRGCREVHWRQKNWTFIPKRTRKNSISSTKSESQLLFYMNHYDFLYFRHLKHYKERVGVGINADYWVYHRIFRGIPTIHQDMRIKRIRYFGEFNGVYLIIQRKFTSLTSTFTNPIAISRNFYGLFFQGFWKDENLWFSTRYFMEIFQRSRRVRNIHLSEFKLERPDDSFQKWITQSWARQQPKIPGARSRQISSLEYARTNVDWTPDHHHHSPITC